MAFRKKKWPNYIKCAATRVYVTTSVVVTTHSDSIHAKIEIKMGKSSEFDENNYF